VPINGIELAVSEWSGEPPTVFLCHATGFHARIWDQVIARLPGRHCIAFDARGHGLSSKPEPPYGWRNFGADIAALADALQLKGVLGVGHSLGGHSVTLGGALRPSAFSALVLLDPVIQLAEAYRGGPWEAAAFVRKRRNQWASPQEMFDRFQNRRPFNTWDARVLRDYCDHALRRDGDSYVLACPPDIEVSIFEHNQAVDSNIWAEIATVETPVHVVRAGLKDPSHLMAESLTAPSLAASFRRGRDTLLTEHSHFIPMEAPEMTAKFVTDALALL
jgi:lipase